MLDMSDVMRRLAVERPLFHSEADFQHALAWKIHELAADAQIRLEVPSGRLDKKERIDILVRLASKTYAIELKYKKRKLDYGCAGEKFAFTDDSAHPPVATISSRTSLALSNSFPRKPISRATRSS
jgi:hypothetical protein